eukprot:SM000190S04847  [mRNA]  locus=s190:55496:56046:+ [translate_table: standard]
MQLLARPLGCQLHCKSAAGHRFQCPLSSKSTKKFGPEQQRFEHLTFLNLAQNVVCFTWASLTANGSRWAASTWLDSK